MGVLNFMRGVIDEKQFGVRYRLLHIDHLVQVAPEIVAAGNEQGTLELPAISVPVGSYLGFSLRSSTIGAAGELLSLQGSYIPFAKTRAEQEANKDPRPSIDSLYKSYAEYEKEYLESAQARIADGYILPEELPRLKALCEKFKPLFETGSR